MSPKKRTEKIEKFSSRATKWIGSSNSLIFHTIFFAIMAVLSIVGVDMDKVLLVLTTIVSLEAIYLSIFIQMTVNKNTADIEDIAEDVEEIAEDVEDIAEDVEGIEKDVDEIQQDVDEIQKDVDEIQEDVEDIEEVHDQKSPKGEKNNHPEILEKIQHVLEALAKDVEALKNKEK